MRKREGGKFRMRMAMNASEDARASTYMLFSWLAFVVGSSMAWTSTHAFAVPLCVVLPVHALILCRRGNHRKEALRSPSPADRTGTLPSPSGPAHTSPAWTSPPGDAEEAMRPTQAAHQDAHPQSVCALLPPVSVLPCCCISMQAQRESTRDDVETARGVLGAWHIGTEGEAGLSISRADNAEAATGVARTLLGPRTGTTKCSRITALWSLAMSPGTTAGSCTALRPTTQKLALRFAPSPPQPLFSLFVCSPFSIGPFLQATGTARWFAGHRHHIQTLQPPPCTIHHHAPYTIHDHAWQLINHFPHGHNSEIGRLHMIALFPFFFPRDSSRCNN